jgi:hypothetical protein
VTEIQETHSMSEITTFADLDNYLADLEDVDPGARDARNFARRLLTEVAKQRDINAELKAQAERAEGQHFIKAQNPAASLDPSVLAYMDADAEDAGGAGTHANARLRRLENLKLPEPGTGATFEDVVKTINAELGASAQERRSLPDMTRGC